MRQSKLFDLIKWYSFFITPVILVYSLYIMLDKDNSLFGICGSLIFIVSLCVFLIIGQFKNIYNRLYKIFYCSYSVLASVLILIVFLWQIGVDVFILGKDQYLNEVIINLFFSIMIILGIGSFLLELIKHDNSGNKD